MQFIGGDADKDIAVLQLQAPPEKLEELRPVQLGTSTNLMVGQKVYAIGNPFGLDHTLTQVTYSAPIHLIVHKSYPSLKNTPRMYSDAGEAAVVRGR